MEKTIKMVCCVIFFSGCATGGVSMTLGPAAPGEDACRPHPKFGSFGIKTIAVAGFASSTVRKDDQYVIHPKFNAHPNTRDIYTYIENDGEVAAAAMENALMQSYRFRIVERRAIDKILKEQRLQLTGLVDAREAAQIGKMAGADALLMGEVTGAFAQYVHKTMSNGDFIGTHIPTALLEMRLVDVESGEIVWNCSISRSALNYLREPFVVSTALISRNVSFTDPALMGATPEARIKNVLIHTSIDAVKYLSP